MTGLGPWLQGEEDYMQYVKLHWRLRAACCNHRKALLINFHNPDFRSNLQSQASFSHLWATAAPYKETNNSMSNSQALVLMQGRNKKPFTEPARKSSISRLRIAIIPYNHSSCVWCCTKNVFNLIPYQTSTCIAGF